MSGEGDKSSTIAAKKVKFVFPRSEGRETMFIDDASDMSFSIYEILCKPSSTRMKRDSGPFDTLAASTQMECKKGTYPQRVFFPNYDAGDDLMTQKSDTLLKSLLLRTAKLRSFSSNRSQYPYNQALAKAKSHVVSPIW